ncbi:MAG: hypothetical protein Q9197_000991 [Variospora fuerteventurae]
MSIYITLLRRPLVVAGDPTVGTFGKWAAQVGDNFWTWRRDVYAAYKKSCAFQPPDYTKTDLSQGITYDPSVFDNNGGPLQVSYGSYFGPSETPLQAAMRGAGLNPISGLKSGKLIEYGTMTATVDIRTANSYGCQELVSRRHFASTTSVWSPTSPELGHKDSQPSLTSGMKGANV